MSAIGVVPAASASRESCAASARSPWMMAEVSPVPQCVPACGVSKLLAVVGWVSAAGETHRGTGEALPPTLPVSTALIHSPHAGSRPVRARQLL